MTDLERRQLVEKLTKQALDPHCPSCPSCGKDALEGYILDFPNKYGGTSGIHCTNCGWDPDPPDANRDT